MLFSIPSSSTSPQPSKGFNFYSYTSTTCPPTPPQSSSLPESPSSSSSSSSVLSSSLKSPTFPTLLQKLASFTLQAFKNKYTIGVSNGITENSTPDIAPKSSVLSSASCPVSATQICRLAEEETLSGKEVYLSVSHGLNFPENATFTICSHVSWSTCPVSCPLNKSDNQQFDVNATSFYSPYGLDPLTSRNISEWRNMQPEKTVSLTRNVELNHHKTISNFTVNSSLCVLVFHDGNLLGRLQINPWSNELTTPEVKGWYNLDTGDFGSDLLPTSKPKIFVNLSCTPLNSKKIANPEDFQILRLIGRGTFGHVFQVRKKDSGRIYAMKVLSKELIVAKKEIAHTLDERNILARTASGNSSFVIGLRYSFQTASDLYLVTDYMSGGELFWHLQQEGRFGEARAKFYAAELVLALQHLHDMGIVYRDLKPENVLLDGQGHVVLCDFGLSKANLVGNSTTRTFCGTTEYLAPEMLLDENGYTKMVDFWSLGVLVFEICCGWSPFYADDVQQMYKNIAFAKIRFPRDALSEEARSFVRALLVRDPKQRLGSNGDAEEVKAHVFFADIDWQAMSRREIVPPFKPRLRSESDVSNFDPQFTNVISPQSEVSTVQTAQLALNMESSVDPSSGSNSALSPSVQEKFRNFSFTGDEAWDEAYFYARNITDFTIDEKIMDSDGEEGEEITTRMVEADRGTLNMSLWENGQRDSYSASLSRSHSEGESENTSCTTPTTSESKSLCRLSRIVVNDKAELDGEIMVGNGNEKYLVEKMTFFKDDELDIDKKREKVTMRSWSIPLREHTTLDDMTPMLWNTTGKSNKIGDGLKCDSAKNKENFSKVMHA